MHHFPILQELFQSDSVIILLIGAVIGAVIFCTAKEPKKISQGLIISIIIYATCEGLSNIRTNYFLELILLFAGTAALGAAASAVICMIIKRRQQATALHRKE